MNRLLSDPGDWLMRMLMLFFITSIIGSVIVSVGTALVTAVMHQPFTLALVVGSVLAVLWMRR